MYTLCEHNVSEIYLTFDPRACRKVCAVKSSSIILLWVPKYKSSPRKRLPHARPEETLVFSICTKAAAAFGVHAVGVFGDGAGLQTYVEALTSR